MIRKVLMVFVCLCTAANAQFGNPLPLKFSDGKYVMGTYSWARITEDGVSKKGSTGAGSKYLPPPMGAPPYAFGTFDFPNWTDTSTPNTKVKRIANYTGVIEWNEHQAQSRTLNELFVADISDTFTSNILTAHVELDCDVTIDVLSLPGDKQICARAEGKIHNRIETNYEVVSGAPTVLVFAELTMLTDTFFLDDDTNIEFNEFGCTLGDNYLKVEYVDDVNDPKHKKWKVRLKVRKISGGAWATPADFPGDNFAQGANNELIGYFSDTGLTEAERKKWPCYFIATAESGKTKFPSSSYFALDADPRLTSAWRGTHFLMTERCQGPGSPGSGTHKHEKIEAFIQPRLMWAKNLFP